jgi:hypothetical protein
MNKKIPPCPCGARRYFEPFGGGTMGPTYSIFHHYCPQCHRAAVEISRGGLCVFLIDGAISAIIHLDADKNPRGSDLPPYVLDYANTTHDRGPVLQ